MKTLLMSLIGTFMCFSLFAQVDSTNNPNPPTVTPQTPVPMNNNVTDSSSNMNSMNRSNMDSMNHSNMDSMNNNMNSTGMVNNSNTPGQPNYAALPVLETYVPDNIVADVKQQHEGSYVYDITAVKAQRDSTIAMSSMNQNSTTITNADSTNPGTTTTTNPTANTNSTTGGQNSGMSTTPQEYNYVVRYLQGGTMTTEILNNSGTKINNP